MTDPDGSRAVLDRRTVLKTLGGVAVLSGVPTMASATIERPTDDARCWIMNGADQAIDLYVNYAPTPLITDVTPTEDGPVFSIDSSANGVYGTYTFEARPAGDTDGPVLASASARFEEHDSYTATFHRTGDDDYQLSVYENDFRPSNASRLEVRHNARPERIDWRLFPKSEADPSIPDDERSGTLTRGQWQEAIDVTPNDYRLEILVDGEVVAYRQDLELEHERKIVTSVVGDPKPWMGSDQKESHVRRNEFQIPDGQAREDAITPPSAPASTTDDNRSLTFDYDPVTVYETNTAETEIAVTDPDGIVNGLAVDGVTPSTDGIEIPDNAIQRPAHIGGTLTATLAVRPKVAPGTYDVRLTANPEGVGETVSAPVRVVVTPVTISRLRDLVDRYEQTGAVTDACAATLHGYLDDAARQLDGGGSTACSDDGTTADADVCAALKRVIAFVGERKGAGVSEAAAIDITRETRALRDRLGCG